MWRAFLLALALSVSPVLAQNIPQPSGGSSGGGGTIYQGTPNAGGANAWPVTDVGVLSAVQSPASPASTTASCTALCSNLVLEASGPHNLYSFEVSADSTLAASAWWIMVWNLTALPSNGSGLTPFKCYAQAAGTVSASYALPTPVTLATGITIGVSTTGCFQQTASIHAFISGDAQ